MTNKPPVNLFLLTLFALVAFAGNSLLCRLALKETQIDAASFNTIRLVSGALVLTLIVVFQNARKVTLTPSKHSLLSALSLFVYAAGFTFAYIDLSAATGALLLFGSVQLTMLSYAIYSGERLSLTQTLGLALALLGLLFLLLPESTAPSITEAVLMMLAGIAWGAYSILGKYSSEPTKTAAQSFVFSLPLTLMLSLILLEQISLDLTGAIYAVVSGAVTSGLGYAIWYRVLPFLKSTVAASAQLSVPPLTAIGGALFIGESITLELMASTLAIIGGIALVTFSKAKAND